jgi:type IV pilus assembly protein PilC
MSEFAYSAINADGIELTGVVKASDHNSAREQLRSRGLLAQRVEAVANEASPRRRKKVKARSLQLFARQFATMIDAGVNIVSALVVLEEQTDDKMLVSIVRAVREDVEGGTPLSQAMAKHPHAFNRLFVSMVEAGEAAGILATVLDRVAAQVEKETRIKRQVKGAMIYPAVVLGVATLVLIGMLVFLVPMFVGVFEELGGELPMLTQLVLTLSNGLRGYWFILLPAAGGGIYALRRWKRSENGRRKWDAIKLRLPMKVGDVVRKVAIARFARTLSTLVASGVDIISALEITGQTAGNAVIEDALTTVRERVHEGTPIAQPLIENPVFPPMVSQMVRIGENTGELEAMLSKIADFYEEEVDTAISALTSIIEPIMMMGVGVMVGIVVISMYLPMFKLLTLIQ